MSWFLILSLIVTFYTAKKTSFDLINEAFRKGEISQIEYLDYLKKSVISPDDLPENYRGVNEPCGTPATIEAFRKFGVVLLSRPSLSGPEETIETEHFIIHYTQSGEDACSPSYANFVANVAEYSWYVEVDSLGWDAPPPDYGMGGDDRYDIYIIYLSGGVMGYTQAEYAGPDPNQEDATSYVAISNSLSNNDIKATVSHEFNHACQLSYSYNEGIWWMENCATWMGDVVYDDIDYYILYLVYSSPNPLDRPDYPITSDENLYWYAGAIWPMFLSEYYDIDMPRLAWARMGVNYGEHTLPDINYVLYNDYSSNLWVAFKNYAIWRYFTGDRADDYHFEEAASWPTSSVWATHDSYPASTAVSGDQFPDEPGGCNYIEFLGEQCSQLILSFDGDDGSVWGVEVVGLKSSGPPDEWDIPLDVGYTFTDTFSFNDYTRIVTIPVLIDWYASGVDIPYSYEGDTTMIVPDIEVEPQIVDIYDTDTGSFFVLNLGEGDLQVYSITPFVDWITDVSPDSFSVEPGDSQKVIVTVDTTGMDTLEAGYLSIYSNDPDETYKLVQVRVHLTPYICGDINGDGLVDQSDLIYLGNYLYGGGPPPVSFWAADVNGDGYVDSSDLIYLGNYLFNNGPPPQCGGGTFKQKGE